MHGRTNTNWLQRRMTAGRLVFFLVALLVLFSVPFSAAGCLPIDPERVLDAAAEQAATVAAPVPTIAAVGPEGAVRTEGILLAENTTISYTVVLPPNYAAGQPYPVLLALPPGSQTPGMVAAGLDSYWQAGALANGWVVVSPVAPGGQLFFQGAERYLPMFLATLARRYPPEGDKFYLSGISNGGLSAFRIAGTHPELFHALLVLPGYPPTAADQANLAKLTAMPVAMYVGANDSGWLRPMRETTTALNNQGGQATLAIVPNEGHFIRSLIGGEALFVQLEAFRRPVSSTN